jgi:hypothetical protein
VQVDPNKPELKAPGTQRLKLQYDKRLSNFAFKFNLRRYVMKSNEAARVLSDLPVDCVTEPGHVMFRLGFQMGVRQAVAAAAAVLAAAAAAGRTGAVGAATARAGVGAGAGAVGSTAAAAATRVAGDAAGAEDATAAARVAEGAAEEGAVAGADDDAADAGEVGRCRLTLPTPR